jgi:hypothetical protein
MSRQIGFNLKKTMPNNGSGFPPNVTMTSVATPYNGLAAELQCFPNRRIWKNLKITMEKDQL